ncbi:hypothetical protein [Microbacterium oxydans]|uniref:hypothetical protein n=1 Tax=Microbacterium oxydans TaxID=82380 RepID=UPI0022B18BA8|nr:hypothetical protein [Microbacterium oxydans]MCZ4301275.1 hypothetical protein [Microbacterium oxydans]
MTTESTHDYAARVLDPAGDIPLGLDRISGGVSLDGSRIPHVESEITVAVPDAALLEQLDPRDSRRVVIDVRATFPIGTRQRSFDLGIREATPDRAGGTVTLRLASDEAILMDYAQLVDDNGPRAHQASLRAVCNYVLGKIGAALQPGTLDADVTAYWAVTNLVTNPRLANDAGSWLVGSGASAGARVVMSAPLPPIGNTAFRWTAAAGESNVVPLSTRFRVTPGKWYVFSAYICSGTARQARAAIQWWSAGNVLSSTTFGAPIASDVTAFRRVSVIAQCPPGAEEVVPYISTLANASGNLHYVSCAMFHEGNELVPYGDGATAPGAGYTWAWQGNPHASTSTRTPVIERRPETLLWTAGVSGMAFLEVLLKSAGLRLVCDEQRRWTLRDADYRANGAQSYRHAVNIETADERLSRDEADWYDAAVYDYVWVDAAGIQHRRQDTYALHTPPSKVLRVELTDTPFPGPGRAQHIVERAQGRGRTVTVSAIPSWLEQTDQPLSILLEGTPIQTGIAGSIRFNFSNDTVTASSRTTDTPASAWELIPSGESWLDSPAGASWIGEVI